MILFLVIGGGIVFVAVLQSVAHTKRVSRLLQSKTVRHHFPLSIQLLVLLTEAGQLTKVVEHVSVVSLVAALLLLAILIATRSGTEVHLD